MHANKEIGSINSEIPLQYVITNNMYRITKYEVIECSEGQGC